MGTVRSLYSFLGHGYGYECRSSLLAEVLGHHAPETEPRAFQGPRPDGTATPRPDSFVIFVVSSDFSKMKLINTMR